MKWGAGGLLWFVVVIGNVFGQAGQDQTIGLTFGEGTDYSYDSSGNPVVANRHSTSQQYGMIELQMLQDSALPEGHLRVQITRTSNDSYGSYSFYVFLEVVNGQVVNLHCPDRSCGVYDYAPPYQVAFCNGDCHIGAATTSYVVSEVAAETATAGQYSVISLLSSNTVTFNGNQDDTFSAGSNEFNLKVGLLTAKCTPAAVSIHGHFFITGLNNCELNRALRFRVGGQEVQVQAIGRGESFSQSIEATAASGTTYQWIVTGLDNAGNFQSVNVGEGEMKLSFVDGEPNDDYYDEARQLVINCDAGSSPTPSPSPSPSGTPTPLPSPTPSGTPFSSPTPTPGGGGGAEPTPGAKTFGDIQASPSPDINGQGSRIAQGIDTGVAGASGGMGSAVSQVQCWGTASFGAVQELPLPLSVFNASWPSGVAVPSWASLVRAVILWLEVVVAFMAGLRSFLSLKVQ